VHSLCPSHTPVGDHHLRPALIAANSVLLLARALDSVDQSRFSAASRRANSSTELLSSRVTVLINSEYLDADATVERDGHRISTRSLISQTLSETCGAMSPAASWTRVVLVIGDHFLAK